MKKNEYLAKLQAIELEVNRRKSDLAHEYACANNPRRVGDVAEDHLGFVRVEEISIHISYEDNLPECIYHGAVLTKKLVPTKKKDNRREVYQCNLVST